MSSTSSDIDSSSDIMPRNDIIFKPEVDQSRLSSAYVTDACPIKIIQSCIDLMKLYEFEFIQKSNTWHICYLPPTDEIIYITIELFRDVKSTQHVIDCRSMRSGNSYGFQLRKQLINMITDVYVAGSEPIDLSHSRINLPQLPSGITDELNASEHMKIVYDECKKRFIDSIDRTPYSRNMLAYNFTDLRFILSRFIEFTSTDGELISRICEFISRNFKNGYHALILSLRFIYMTSLADVLFDGINLERKSLISGIADGTITNEMFHVRMYEIKLDTSKEQILVWRMVIKCAKKVIEKVSH
jgi:hypothetical protein